MITQPAEIRSVLNTFPALAKLYAAETVESYMGPLMSWRYDPVSFPHSSFLIELIERDTARLYGTETAKDFSVHLERGAYVAETGLHLHMPRNLDKIQFRTKAYENINTLTTQSVLTTTALHKRYRQPYKLSLFTGIIPGTNTHSAAYWQPSTHGCDLPRLISNKWAQYCESSLPALDHTKIDELSKVISTLDKDTDKEQALQVLSIFRDKNGSFSDQISAASGWLYQQLQTAAQVRQITLDLHIIAVDYLTQILADKNSLMSFIFKDQSTADDFARRFAGIRTGWKEGETPFIQLSIADYGDGTSVYKPGGVYQGPCDRETLLNALEAKTIMPSGAMGFAALMIEGGLLATGGMFQSDYCTQIRDRAVSLLHDYGDMRRAEKLAAMPTDIATVTPVWGIDHDNPPDLLNYAALLDRLPIDSSVFDRIPSVTGASALYGAAPALMSLTGENPDLTAWQSKLSDYNLLQL